MKKIIISLILVTMCLNIASLSIYKNKNFLLNNDFQYSVTRGEIIQYNSVNTVNKKYTTVKVNFRSKPNLKSKIIKVLNKNTQVIELGTKGNWTIVEYNNKIGYIFTKYLSSKKEISNIKINSRGSETIRNTEKTKYLGKYKITAYCRCSKCCGKNTGITSSGTKATAGRTIAAPSNFAFGTKLKINNHIYTVEDRGGAIKGNRIDIFFNSHSEALKWGVKYINVYKVN